MNGEIAIEYIHVHVVGRMHFQCIYMCFYEWLAGFDSPALVRTEMSTVHTEFSFSLYV